MNNKGFTLLEVLVTTVLFSFVIVAVYNVFEASNSVFKTSSALLDVTQEARTCMFRLLKEVRAATGLSLNNSTSITFSTPSEGNITYYLYGNSLVRYQADDGARVFASHIGELQFSQPGNDTKVLQIGLTVNKQVMLRDYSFKLLEQVRLRNE